MWDRPIVTEVVPLAAFYPAEEYHQEYFRRTRTGLLPDVVAPKLDKFRRKIAAKLKKHVNLVEHDDLKTRWA